MQTWHKVLLITLGTALPAFVLGPIIWPQDPHGAAPSGLQLLLFMALAALESLTLGLAVAFISYGLPLVRRVAGGSGARTWITFIATAWLLISWWPHDNMHKHNGMDLDGLLMIEYLFHLSMMVAGVVLAYTLVRALQTATTTGEALDHGYKLVLKTKERR
jgi:hypothetical protein